MTPPTPPNQHDLTEFTENTVKADKVGNATPPEQHREARYLIRKGGAYYRPNAQGYTRDSAEAGRYTLTEAIAHSHPNGPNGPRDGIDYILAAPPEAERVEIPEVGQCNCGLPKYGAGEHSEWCLFKPAADHHTAYYADSDPAVREHPVARMHALGVTEPVDLTPPSAGMAGESYRPLKLTMPNGNVLTCDYPDADDWARSWTTQTPEGRFSMQDQDWEIVEEYGLTALLTAAIRALPIPDTPAEPDGGAR